MIQTGSQSYICRFLKCPLFVSISAILCMMYLNTASWIANSIDPNQTLHSAASDMDLHCLLRHNCLNFEGKYVRYAFELTSSDKRRHPLTLVLLNEPRYILPLQTVQIQISWLLQKPTDLDLHCLSFSMWRCVNNLHQVIWLADN